MSSDWVQPLATVIVGVAGVGGTWLAGRRQGEVALGTARLAAENAQRLAQEDRTQKRIESAYRDLDRNLSILESLLVRLTPNAPLGQFHGLATLPADYLPSSTLEALNQDRLYRSPTVQGIMAEFDTEVAFLNGHFSTVLAQGPKRGEDPGLMTALAADVSDHAALAVRIIQRVRARMSAELRGAEIHDEEASGPPGQRTARQERGAGEQAYRYGSLR